MGKDWGDNPNTNKIIRSNWWYVAAGILIAIGLILSLATGRIPFT